MSVKKDIGSRMAYAGIGAAISLVFVVLAYFVRNLSLSFYVLSSIGIMLPLTKGYYREALIASAAVTLAGFFIVNLSIIPFVAASGFYVVLTIFLYEKKFNRILGYVLKFFYSGLLFFICYSVISLISIDFSKLPSLGNLTDIQLYAILNLIFSAAFLIYDVLVEKGFIYLRGLLNKMIKGKK